MTRIAMEVCDDIIDSLIRAAICAAAVTIGSTNDVESPSNVINAILEEVLSDVSLLGRETKPSDDDIAHAQWTLFKAFRVAKFEEDGWNSKMSEMWADQLVTALVYAQIDADQVARICKEEDEERKKRLLQTLFGKLAFEWGGLVENFVLFEMEQRRRLPLNIGGRGSEDERAGGRRRERVDGDRERVGGRSRERVDGDREIAGGRSRERVDGDRRRWRDEGDRRGEEWSSFCGERRGGENRYGGGERGGRGRFAKFIRGGRGRGGGFAAARGRRGYNEDNPNLLALGSEHERRVPTCFNCGEKGHVNGACPKPWGYLKSFPGRNGRGSGAGGGYPMQRRDYPDEHDSLKFREDMNSDGGRRWRKRGASPPPPPPPPQRRDDKHATTNARNELSLASEAGSARQASSADSRDGRRRPRSSPAPPRILHVGRDDYDDFQNMREFIYGVLKKESVGAFDEDLYDEAKTYVEVLIAARFHYAELQQSFVHKASRKRKDAFEHVVKETISPNLKETAAEAIADYVTRFFDQDKKTLEMLRKVLEDKIIAYDAAENLSRVVDVERRSRAAASAADVERRSRDAADVERRSRTAADVERRSRAAADVERRSRAATDVDRRSRTTATAAATAATADVDQRSRAAAVDRRSHAAADIDRRSYAAADVERRSRAAADNDDESADWWKPAQKKREIRAELDADLDDYQMSRNPKSKEGRSSHKKPFVEAHACSMDAEVSGSTPGGGEIQKAARYKCASSSSSSSSSDDSSDEDERGGGRGGEPEKGRADRARAKRQREASGAAPPPPRYKCSASEQTTTASAAGRGEKRVRRIVSLVTVSDDDEPYQSGHGSSDRGDKRSRRRRLNDRRTESTDGLAAPKHNRLGSARHSTPVPPFVVLEGAGRRTEEFSPLSRGAVRPSSAKAAAAADANGTPDDTKSSRRTVTGRYISSPEILQVLPPRPRPTPEEEKGKETPKRQRAAAAAAAAAAFPAPPVPKEEFRVFVASLLPKLYTDAELPAGVDVLAAVHHVISWIDESGWSFRALQRLFLKAAAAGKHSKRTFLNDLTEKSTKRFDDWRLFDVDIEELAEWFMEFFRTHEPTKEKLKSWKKLKQLKSENRGLESDDDPDASAAGDAAAAAANIGTQKHAKKPTISPGSSGDESSGTSGSSVKRIGGGHP